MRKIFFVLFLISGCNPSLPPTQCEENQCPLLEREEGDSCDDVFTRIIESSSLIAETFPGDLDTWAIVNVSGQDKQVSIQTLSPLGGCTIDTRLSLSRTLNGVEVLSDDDSGVAPCSFISFSLANTDSLFLTVTADAQQTTPYLLVVQYR